jgi:predicted pyridoxine 5'-phosphate oxidase superfamily flavin-nucleotide-binding protein
MGILTKEIKEFVNRQKLGFIATVCADGTPNLSPKGTTTAWDDDHLVFADIYSPGTIDNLLINPSIEINVVDGFIRKGYRFKGTATVLSNGPLFEEVVAHYNNRGAVYLIKHVVLVKVERVLPVSSPVYDTGISENEVRKKWITYWNGQGRGNDLKE